ncbi:hypothetical protein [Mycobacterium ostraviense]|uniref:Uncharacterized protein n=1 Tax=Mycobacterium ostraviense TaxID=2738409 RepID=A0A163XKC8_9MYCO|nr:hypothetical protein [Mycobacterium ostraviense]KZS59470.1 hypothetical protein A4G28_20055 [Mycobacterium ostraviense]UGT90289.1 hypothetical protein LTS72_18285 [Mycobacterium ostraviense]
MTVVRAELAPRFYFGDDAVLLAMDTAGVNTVLAALVQAERQGSSRMAHDGKIHDLLIDPGAADIELHDDKVAWRLDDAKAIEIIELSTAMTHSTTGPGHHYVDISAPTETLVLSRNEYV